MIGISEIASYIPEAFESNFDKLEKFGISESFIEEKIGVHHVSRKAPEEDTTDLCIAAFERLKAKCGVEPGDIEAVVLCTQNPDGRGLPHSSAILHGRLGLPLSCACFDVSLGCSGFVYCLSIIKSFMESNGLRRGLIFTADPYSKILDPDDKNTVLLFGDGAAVTLMEECGPERPLLAPQRFRFQTDGSLSSALRVNDGRLHMNGRQVFTYSSKVVPVEIREILRAQGLTFGDIDYFLLHQGSKKIVDIVAKRLELPHEKVPEALAAHGNTVSSTIPILLERLIHDAGARRLLLSGFGVGLSTACCILERRAA